MDNFSIQVTATWVIGLLLFVTIWNSNIDSNVGEKQTCTNAKYSLEAHQTVWSDAAEGDYSQLDRFHALLSYQWSQSVMLCCFATKIEDPKQA